MLMKAINNFASTLHVVIKSKSSFNLIKRIRFWGTDDEMLSLRKNNVKSHQQNLFFLLENVKLMDCQKLSAKHLRAMS